MKILYLIKNAALISVLGTSVIYSSDTDVLQPDVDQENIPPQQQGGYKPPLGARRVYPPQAMGQPMGKAGTGGKGATTITPPVQQQPTVPQTSAGGRAGGSGRPLPNPQASRIPPQQAKIQPPISRAQPQIFQELEDEGQVSSQGAGGQQQVGGSGRPLPMQGGLKPAQQTQLPQRGAVGRMQPVAPVRPLQNRNPVQQRAGQPVAKPQFPPKTAVPSIVPVASAALQPTAPHLFAAHACNKNIYVSNVDWNMKAKPASEPYKVCYDLLSPAGRYDYDAILGALYAKRTEIDTHTKALLSELNDNPDSVMSMIANAYTSDGKNITNVDFAQILKTAHLDSARIRFLFDLSTKVYYKKGFGKQPNNSSLTYQKELVEKEGKVASITAAINRLDEFTKEKIDVELKRTNIARLNVGDSEDDKSDQEVPANVEISPQQGKGGRQHVAIQHLGPKYKIEVQNIHSEIIKSLVQNYNKDFKANLPENSSLTELEGAVAANKGSLKKDLLEAEMALRIYKDPNLRDFYAKLELILKKEARDFTPIDVFYRSANYSTRYEFLSELADKKANPENDQKLKEISGVVLLKMDQNPNDKPPVDEFLIVFSGSNSATDWKHNLNWFKSQGRSDHDIATGLRVHGGILDSLHETLTEFGTKFHYWLEKYRTMRPGIKPKLVFTVSGHSLGGALALLMGVFIRQNVTEFYGSDVDVEVKIVTFGAPPMFNQRSAQEVEKLIPNYNNLRFWNIGDPVANLSIIQKDTRESRSAIARLLGFYHVGTSIPLFDTRKMAARSEILNPWKAHLADRYTNLLYIDWVDNGTQQMANLNKILQRKGLTEELKLFDPLNRLILFIEDGTDASAKIDGLTTQYVADLMKEHQAASENIEPTVANLSKLQKQRYQMGVTTPHKFTKVDLSQEVPTIKYTQKVGGDYFQQQITLDRSTSCQFDNLQKQFDRKYKGMNFDASRDQISCTCCVVKNTFVSYGAGNILQKAKDFVRRKDTKTPASILQYCVKEKHCANDSARLKLFPQNQDIISSFSVLMDNLGLTKEWNEKKVE